MKREINKQEAVKYTFKRVDERMRMDDKLLVCPNCLETLAQADIENFSRCPFCDYKLEINLELEDFILQPLVDHWMRQQEIVIPFEDRSEESANP